MRLQATTWYRGVLVASIACGAACENDRPRPPAPESASAATSPSPNRATGALEHPDNDPKLVALAQKTLDCKPWEKVAITTRECHDRQLAFTESSFEGKDATLVNLLADDDPRVVSLAVAGLRRSHDWRGDRGLASRVLDVLDTKIAKRATDTADVAELAGAIDVGRADCEKRVRDLFRTTEDVDVLGAFVKSLQLVNGDVFVDALLEMTRDEARPGLRRHALLALNGAPRQRKEEVCKAWRARLADEDEQVLIAAVEMIASTAGRPPGCPEYHLAMMESLEARATRPVTSSLVSLMIRLSRNEPLARVQRPHMIIVLKRVVELEKNTAETRGHALAALDTVDTREAIVLAGKLLEDPAAPVAAAAAKIWQKRPPAPTKPPPKARK